MRSQLAHFFGCDLRRCFFVILGNRKNSPNRMAFENICKSNKHKKERSSTIVRIGRSAQKTSEKRPLKSLTVISAQIGLTPGRVFAKWAIPRRSLTIARLPTRCSILKSYRPCSGVINPEHLFRLSLELCRFMQITFEKLLLQFVTGRRSI